MIDELYGSAVRILRLAAGQSVLRPIYADSRETARGLADNGYLSPFGSDGYRITQKGRDYLQGRQLTTPVRRVVKDPAGRGRRNRPTQTPTPQQVQNILHCNSVAFDALSKKQRDILCFVDCYIRDIAISPTYREIGKAVGISSVSVVRYTIEALMKGGWVAHTDGVSRALRVIRELPGYATKHNIRVDHGVLKIAVNLHGKPQTVIDAAHMAIERLREVIASAGQ